MPWQRWVVRVLGELQGMHGTPGLRRWDTAIAHLAAAMKHLGSHARHRWTAGSVAPSFELIMQFCYTCNTTPKQLVLGQVGSLERAIHDTLAAHPIRRPRSATHRRLDRERCRAVILAVLDGREPPLGPHQVAKHLGCAEQSLRRSFPKECALLAQLAQASRQQQRQRRIAEVVAQVRHEVEVLHAQGTAPTSCRLGRILPTGTMRQPEASAAWRAALRDLGRRP